MTVFGVSDLVVRYGRHTAVDGVTLTVEAGAVVALVGADGAGKSSVLRALAGALTPAGGRVTAPPRTQIGYVPADTGVYRDLTTVENLAFAGSAYGLSGPDLADRIAAELDTIGLGTARARLAGDLSGGMRQKLALACAMLHRPRLLILDEATTGVDPVSRAEVWRGIARAAAGGTAVVFASTYLDEAVRAGHIVVIDDGRMLLSGTLSAILGGVGGHLTSLDHRPTDGWVYRRGTSFRVWDPHGDPADTQIEVDLHDAVTIASFAASTAGATAGEGP